MSFEESARRAAAALLEATSRDTDVKALRAALEDTRARRRPYRRGGAVMSFEESARRAAAALLEATSRDTDVKALRAALEDTRARRRTRAVVAAAVTGIAAVTVALALARPAAPSSPLPATSPPATTSTAAAPVPRAEELVTSQGVRAALTGTAPAGSPVHAIAFSPNGDRVAYSDRDNEVDSTWVTPAGLGTPRRIAAASWDIAWTPDGLQLVLAGPDGVKIHTLATSTTRPLPLPPDWKVASVDINADGLLALQGGDQNHPRSSIMTVDVTGARPRVVLTDPGQLYFARWSPDGRTIAFIRKNAPSSTDPTQTGDITLESVGADGTGRTVLARAGTAAFMGITPGLDWSPEGRLAYVGGEQAQDALGDVRASGGGGVRSIQRNLNGPLAWRASSP